MVETVSPTTCDGMVNCGKFLHLAFLVDDHLARLLLDCRELLADGHVLDSPQGFLGCARCFLLVSFYHLGKMMGVWCLKRRNSQDLRWNQGRIVELAERAPRRRPPWLVGRQRLGRKGPAVAIEAREDGREGAGASFSDERAGPRIRQHVSHDRLRLFHRLPAHILGGAVHGHNGARSVDGRNYVCRHVCDEKASHVPRCAQRERVLAEEALHDRIAHESDSVAGATQDHLASIGSREARHEPLEEHTKERDSDEGVSHASDRQHQPSELKLHQWDVLEQRHWHEEGDNNLDCLLCSGLIAVAEVLREESQQEYYDDLAGSAQHIA
mmetsp:Transcript_128028/g.370514  ORF Transcript_128028/g.370514 Transcript_128028/m.370514 type:complete len:326 (+) Transcript_128028:607-1584(+)